MSDPITIVPTEAHLRDAKDYLFNGAGKLDDLALALAKAEAFDDLQAITPPLPLSATPPFAGPTETYVCPDEGCGATIPLAHVFPDWHSSTRRVLTAHCPSCERVWQASFVAGPLGGWHLERPPALVTRGAKVRRILARVDALRRPVAQAC